MATYTLAQRAEIELEIRKSRFIGIVMPVAGREAAMQEIGKMREAHRSATHVCWALMAGGQSGMSDDGEPSGTAGRPMLEVLRHHELDGVLARSSTLELAHDEVARRLQGVGTTLKAILEKAYMAEK